MRRETGNDALSTTTRSAAEATAVRRTDTLDATRLPGPAQERRPRTTTRDAARNEGCARATPPSASQNKIRPQWAAPTYPDVAITPGKLQRARAPARRARASPFPSPESNHAESPAKATH